MLATEATPVEVCLAFEALGRHAVPGPWVESAAVPARRAGPRGRGRSPRSRCRRTSRTRSTPTSPTRSTSADDASPTPTSATLHVSVDRTRRLFDGDAGEPVDAVESATAFDLAVLATSAQLLGARRAGARRLGHLREAAQAVRPRDRLLPGDQARAGRRPDRARLRPAAGLRRRARRDARLSAAKVACADAAYLASRTGLQVHGAIGYTAEFDLSIWLTKIRALVGAWGTPAFHRGGSCAGRWTGLMEFGFSEEQQELASTVRSLLAKRADSAAVRAAAESETGYDESLWQLLCEQIGVAALRHPRGVRRRRVLAVRVDGRARGARPLAGALAPARLAGHRRGAAGRRRTRTPSSGCSPASRPARSRRSPSTTARRSFADQATVLLAVRRRRPAGARPGVERPELAAFDGPDHPVRVARRGRRRPGSATAPRPGPGPSWSAPSAWPRSRPAWRRGRWR